MKLHHKVIFKFFLLTTALIFCSMVVRYFHPKYVNIIVGLEVAINFLFLTASFRLYHRERKTERWKELNSYLIMHVRDIVRATRAPQNPDTIKKLPTIIIWDENKTTFYVNADTAQIRVSEKWLYEKANKTQRFFLIRWCKHFLYYSSVGLKAEDAIMNADWDAVDDCIAEHYSRKKLFSFILEAFSYPNSLSIARIDQIKSICIISEK